MYRIGFAQSSTNCDTSSSSHIHILFRPQSDLSCRTHGKVRAATTNHPSDLTFQINYLAIRLLRPMYAATAATATTTRVM